MASHDVHWTLRAKAMSLDIQTARFGFGDDGKTRVRRPVLVVTVAMHDSQQDNMTGQQPAS